MWSVMADARLTAVLGHHLIKAREGRVGQSTAVLEALDHAQNWDELSGDRDIVRRGRPGQPCGVLVKKVVGPMLRVVLDDPADNYRGEHSRT